MSEVVRSKIRQLFLFLKEANQLRFRPIRALSEQPKVIRFADMPNHPAIQVFRPVRTDNDEVQSDILLRVKRPVLTKCPSPPDLIASWLLSGWDDPNKSVSVVESQNTIDAENLTTTVRFEDDNLRPIELGRWKELRSSWLVPEISARKAMSFFETLYDIHSTIEKDGEELEFLAADGHLLWQAVSDNDGSVAIRHPILLKRIELRFDPDVPEFTVHDTDREPEIYSSLFVDLQGIAPVALRSRRNELERAGYHPLGWEDTDAFLKAFIQTVSPLNGEYLEGYPSGSASTSPKLYRDMVLLLRKRVAGIANAVDAIIDDIDSCEVFPPALAQITGTMTEWESEGLGTENGQSESSSEVEFNDDDILLAKEANHEQMKIIRRLERSGSVIVQGPPGTGKTHTIGNLIGHLLAQGKSILVTAQTAKALRVVRDKVPEMLRPLAVSVLGSDQDARRQLESSISHITQRLTTDSADNLTLNAKQLDLERKNLQSQIKQLAHKLREALENEYAEIVVGEQHFSPSEAARYVSRNQEEHGWIPAPVELGEKLCLSDQELTRLYSLGQHFSVEEERDVGRPLPILEALPNERQFQIMASEYQELTTTDLTFGADRWTVSGRNAEELESLRHDLAVEFSDEILQQAWRPYAILAGIHGGTEREVWEKLITSIEASVEANSQHALVLHHNPKLSAALTSHEQHQITTDICLHLNNGGGVGFMQLITRAKWRQFIGAASVTAGQPNHIDHFEALKSLAALECLRSSLELPWNSMVGQHNQKMFGSLGSAPELACRAVIPEIRRCLDWHASVWIPLAKRLKADGLKLDELMSSLPREVSHISDYLVIERLASTVLPPLFASEFKRRKLRECEVGFSQLTEIASLADPVSPENGCVGQIIASVRSRSSESYTKAIEYVRRLYAIKPLVAERDALAARLLLVAPAWASQIVNRVLPHDDVTVPGDASQAWIWRQLHDILMERDKLAPQELLHKIDLAKDRLREVTQSLIDAKAWGKQLERLQGNHAVRQALVGWVDTTRRLNSTRQLERRHALISESRKLMKKCVTAVPVWIMPISIMAESFDPKTTRFDVVIVDEASQADLNALIPLYLGKQIIVVGDHEQVTPLGVGTAQATLHNLRQSMLQEIPNSHLFDNMASIYDIGRQSFGDAIRLVEHFRCVPEIIAFSNKLSYDGKILPLRESTSTDIKPACVACRVDGIREDKLNKGEAQKIIDTIKAMIRHPRYANKTIGIISMLGEEQPVLIQSMLHKQISSVEIETRRIQAGISGEFQGDERDIIFLSMVDSSGSEGPLRITGDGAFEQTKKRYNVAASRARDQLWVMHSFDPDLHLKTDDLRFKLLQHVRDPLATMRQFEEGVRRTESPFEREVLKLLTAAGYRVKTQWQAGYYRIDMVVEGGGKRLAIECDGDRYHPLEKLSDDMERQTILERLGWTFIRIRGTAFFRNKELAMMPVFSRLRELEIPPEASSDAPLASDMTLIHELNNMIRQDAERNALENSLSPAIAGS